MKYRGIDWVSITCAKDAYVKTAEVNRLSAENKKLKDLLLRVGDFSKVSQEEFSILTKEETLKERIERTKALQKEWKEKYYDRYKQ